MTLELVTLARHSYSILSLPRSARPIWDLVDVTLLEKAAFYLFLGGLAEQRGLSLCSAIGCSEAIMQTHIH